MNKGQIFHEGMEEAYRLMDSTISSAIKRNGGATTALQIINVFNEFTAHMHYQRMLLSDALSKWDEPCEECEESEVFEEERKELEALLKDIFGITVTKGIGITRTKGGVHS